MKAARIHQHGGPEVLVYEDVPEPQIKANQILVRVRACALNHLDLFVRAGIPGMKFPMPHILGSDIAGEVVEVGELCERVQARLARAALPGPELPAVRAMPLGQRQFLPPLHHVRLRGRWRRLRTAGRARILAPSRSPTI